VLRRLVLFLIAFTFLTVTQGQERCTIESKAVSVDFKNVTLIEVLKTLKSDYNLPLNFDETAIPQVYVTITKDSLTVHDLFRILLVPNKLQHTCLSNTILIQTLVEYQVRCRIKDRATNIPIPGAILLVNNVWYETDDKGLIVFWSHKYVNNVQIFYPGYLPFKASLEPMKKNLIVDMEVSEALADVAIHALSEEIIVPKAQGYFVNLTQLQSIPSVSGSPGVLNGMRFLPGIQSTVDANGGMVVRGGNPDENLVMYDGMEVYNPMHLFGLFSIFSSGSVSSVSFYNDAMPARYSGRLSSVLDVSSQIGNFKSWGGEFNLNPVLIDATLSGPLIHENTSLMLSARRSFTDIFPLFYEQIKTQNGLKDFDYYFFDLSGKVSHIFPDESSLEISAYRGGDVGSIQTDRTLGASSSETNNDGFNQGNNVMSANYSRWLGNTHMTLGGGYSSFGFNQVNSYSVNLSQNQNTYSSASNYDYGNSIQHMKAKMHLKRSLPNGHMTSLGLSVNGYTFRPAEYSYFLQENDFIAYDTTLQSDNTTSREVNLFIQDDFKYKNWRIRAGIHGVFFQSDVNFQSLQPRISVFRSFGKRKSLELHYGRNVQYLFSLPDNANGVPLGIWMSANSNLEPLESYVYSIGWSQSFDKGWRLRAKGYYRDVFRVKNIFPGGRAPFEALDQNVFEHTGRNYGLETTVHKSEGDLSGWISYTYSRSQLKVIDAGLWTWISNQFDRPHDFAVVLDYKWRKNWHAGITWNFASGHYISAPEKQYLLEVNGENQLIQQYESWFNLRVPHYHRLDLGIHHERRIANATQKWSLTVYNVYNRQNVYFVRTETNPNGSLNFQPINVMPILPSINYAIQF
jgi:hypothetical protein